LLGFFVITLDALVVNVALPAIGRDLGGGMTGLLWVVDGYTLMFAALLLFAGTLSDLYVRSYKGSDAAWFRGTQARHEGHIRAGGVEKDVTFVEETDPGINDQIDAMYHTKYRRYGARYVDPMVAPEARAATIKLVPRATT
jgi:hypothetical protein